jgi:hypothetical protein
MRRRLVTALVVYESMFGNTRTIAEAIARGIGSDHATAVAVSDVGSDALQAVELLVVGGPTHVHSMARPVSRKAAREQAAKSAGLLSLEPFTDTFGLREWLDALPTIHVAAAAFDTRMRGPALLTGRASKTIARMLGLRGARIIAPLRSFIVTKANVLQPGELKAAEEWGRSLRVHVRATMVASE